MIVLMTYQYASLPVAEDVSLLRWDSVALPP